MLLKPQNWRRCKVGDLYLIFFASGLLIFVVIVAYSVLQKRQFKPIEKKDYVDPLFAELEERKNKSAQQGDDSLVTERPTKQTADKPAVTSSSGNQGSLAKSAEAEAQVDKHDSMQQQPIIDITERQLSSSPEGNQDQSGSTKSAAIHKAELAPKPKIDKDSASVVTELVARIKNPDPIEQQGLLSLFRKHDFKFHRQVHIYGLNQLTDMWRDIEFELPSARFTELGVSIQLADREGAMSQKELHDFQQMVLEFTNFYDAPFEFSMQIDDALKQALALDQIGRRYDSMAVLNVVPKAKTGFRMADIESCARDLMMATDKNGIFMKTVGIKNNISVLFRLACTDGAGQFGISNGAAKPVHDLVVYMNVPSTKDPEMVFQEMVKDANSLATWLEGKVVDRNGRIMTQRSYSMLMQQVSDIAFSMQQDGFTPGDAVAKKLF
jgi:FtsZ-interacting cell division protein ZipA